MRMTSQTEVVMAVLEDAIQAVLAHVMMIALVDALVSAKGLVDSAGKKLWV